ncbi:MAG: ribosome maturation factor RimP [Thermodesulfovibrionales bacterium]
MDRNAEQKIQALASEVAGDCGYELVDINLSGSGKRAILRITIDKEGGITLDDCEAFSRRLEGLLDVEDPLQGPYTLEVSSPGLDRPLKRLDDFKKHTGKLVRIITKEKINNQTFFVGRLMEVRDDSIMLSITRKGAVPVEVAIPYNIITKANLEIEVGLR